MATEKNISIDIEINADGQLRLNFCKIRLDYQILKGIFTKKISKSYHEKN